MQQPAGGRYGIEGDSECASVTVDEAELARRWAPGATAFGVRLPDNLTFVYLTVAGMRLLLHPVNFEACQSNARPSLVSTLSPQKGHR